MINSPLNKLIELLQMAYSGEMAAAYAYRGHRHAARSNHAEYVECLLTMAEVEWEHEKFFRACVKSHKWSIRIRLWPEPPPKESIRVLFNSEFEVISDGVVNRAEQLSYDSGNA